MKEWISLEDRLPPQDVYVLVAVFDNRPKVQMYSLHISMRLGQAWFDDHNQDDLLGKGQIITHWMPLPDKPGVNLNG